jgi:hypothetical protein
MRWIFLWCALFGAAVTPAHAQDVKVNWDKTSDFRSYKTYAWGQGTPAQNPLIAEWIINRVDNQMIAKGFRKVDIHSDPDLVVLYHAAVGMNTQLNPGGTDAWGWQWGNPAVMATTVDKIPTGQLSVDVGDAKTKKLLWLGSASGTLSKEPAETQETIDKVIEKMFKKFPPPE